MRTRSSLLSFKRSAFAPLLFVCALLTAPAFADSACVSGKLSTLIGTTCDIGALRFTFTAWNSANVSYYNLPSGSFNSAASLSANDVSFSALADGFTLSGSPQSITAPSDAAYSSDAGGLSYIVVDASGEITGESLTDNGLEASGKTASFAEAIGVTVADPCCHRLVEADHTVNQSQGTISSHGPVSSGYGGTFSSSSTDPYESSAAEPYKLFALGGDSASWNGSTTFTFSATNMPEPSSTFALMIGFLCLVAAKRRFSKASS